MRWPRKTRPNLHSRVLANSMIMVGSVQEIDHVDLANKIVRLPAADCLSGQQTIIASKTQPSGHGHVYLSTVCGDYKTRTDLVTWSCISFTNCSKKSNFKTITSTFAT